MSYWECQCCGMKYREEIANQFDTCPNCGLELGEPVHLVLIDWPYAGAARVTEIVSHKVLLTGEVKGQ